MFRVCQALIIENIFIDKRGATNKTGAIDHSNRDAGFRLIGFVG